ncbi:hypothetical protein ACQU0X_30915 [Pseudovibrio ascidiaceicola]|uniref:hypothetical protein n=1 Tax=Pseudovibrio ascidiaceicola TaxID=285279 RepID=UPI003D3681A5
MTVITNYDPALAAEGLIDEKSKQLIEMWKETSFRFNHSYINLLPFMNHVTPPRDADSIAEPLLVGNRSFLALVYGQEWINENPATRARVDPKMMAAVSRDYKISAEILTPRLNLVRTKIQLPKGGSQDTCYFSLILPFTLKRGNVILFSYASPVHQ